jgi:hypothetical protein
MHASALYKEVICENIFIKGTSMSILHQAGIDIKEETDG